MLHPTNETEYRAAIDAIGRPYNTVTGRITFSDDTYIDITDEILSEDPVSVSRQCVDDDKLMFGGVFTDTLNLSIITDVDRYKFFGAKIEINYEIEIAKTVGTSVIYEMESVPLGVFYVADAEKPSDEVNLTAYDSMTLLDKEIGDLLISGAPWPVFQQVSLACDYPLAFTENDLASFPNYDQAIGCSADNGIKTYRDVVKVICQMMGCFACDDRTGKLKLKKFSTTPDLVLGNNSTGDYPWYEFVPADYECSYIGISVTGMQGSYKKITEDEGAFGLIMTMDDAPAWDYGTAEAQELKTAALYELLYDDEEHKPVLIYTPATCDMPSDATYECGDMLQFNTPYSNEPYYVIITSITWNFHNGMTVESKGSNPFLEGSKPADDESTRMVTQDIAKNKLQFIKVTNNAEKTIGDNQSKAIISIIFTPTAQTSALFVATIVVDISDVPDVENAKTEEEQVEVPVKAYDSQSQEVQLVDINGNAVDHLTALGTNTFTYKDIRDGKNKVTIWYVLDEHLLPADEEPYYAIDELPNGKHIITISYLIQIPTVKRYFFDVYMKSEGGTITIPQWSIQAAMLGQEIDEIQRFDGNIRVNDEEPTGTFDIGTVAVTSLTHDTLVETIITDPTETPYEWLPNQFVLIKALLIPDPDGPDYPLVDNISSHNINSMSVIPLTEGTGQLIPHILFYSLYISAENDDTLVTEDDIAFETEGMPSAGT